MANADPTILISQRTMPWKWLLLALCALFSLWTVANFANSTSLAGHAALWGWWDGAYGKTAQPYTVRFDPPQAGGATDKAGIRAGDLLDLREQSFEARVRLFAQPVAGRPIDLVVHRGANRLTVRVVPSTNTQGNVAPKTWTIALGLLSAVWFIGCALLIALRRSGSLEARVLALILLCDSMGGFAGFGLTLVTTGLATTALCFVLPQICALIAMVLLVGLSARFGVRTGLRRLVEVGAYAAIACNLVEMGVFFYALLSLRIDPLTIGLVNFANGLGVTDVLQIIAALAVLTTVAVAVRSTPPPEKTRAAWLLLPLAFTWVAVVSIYSFFENFVHTWAANQGLVVLAVALFVAGGFSVTYAVLKRRVLDFEFVLSRAIVVTTISLIVVASFVLLEWLLGTVVSNASHTTGVIANAALALALGTSLRYLHKRVDTFVDTAFFRKRHDDERALRDFSQEAAYMTRTDALLDQAIAKLQRHTDARSAAFLIEGTGGYETARSFGTATVIVDENDPAIVSLKSWHRPLDPHHYVTALTGELALPMLARGRLRGVVLLGERAGGEAYASDEVDALAQFAHGVGLAFDSISSGEASNDKMTRTLEYMLAEIRALRGSDAK